MSDQQAPQSGQPRGSALSPAIDLYSDTQTRPSEAMRRAMASADVGDEQRGEDPTVTALTDRVARVLGKQAAVFLPSATMANLIAALVHCSPGDEVLLDATSHSLHFEAGGFGAVAGVMTTPIGDGTGIYSAGALRRAVHRNSRHAPHTALAVIEQTANLAGGRCWTLQQIADVAGAANDAGLAVHIDGARLFNAAVALGVSPASLAGSADTVTVDFTKGLGAPVGAALAGTREQIERAWRYKQRLGGAMRQAGIIAAGCLYGLEHHVDRLADDHRNARRLADLLAEDPAIDIDPDAVQTNIVLFSLRDKEPGPALARLHEEHSVRMGEVRPGVVRAITHADVSADDIDTAAAALRSVLAEHH
jgi:threonine aldolase